ncbi:MAG: aspartate carbamoyltransferase catalytic subunit [Planctomycetota bacterium]
MRPLPLMTALRHLVSIDDLSLAEVRELFTRADDFAADPRGFSHLCRGMISASIFYEASTRTRLSFESAMLRLGGGVLTAAEMRTSSASKGESLADTVRVVGGGYADVIVLRHTSEGAARLAAQFATVPVINAGDGSHEHPTQTLCDLYNLHVERGRIEGLDVVLAGDLKYSRTVHSFSYALARFGANIVCVPQAGFEMPDYVLQRLRDEFGVEPVRADTRRLGSLAASSDAVYLTPQKPHQLSLFTDARGWDVQHVDAVYITRPQTERYTDEEDAGSYMRLEKDAMAEESLRDAVLMHPLPRRDEISGDIDGDPRSIYFKQAARGVPIRMAILERLLIGTEAVEPATTAARRGYPVPMGPNPCPNLECISRTEPRHVRPMFTLLARSPVRANCAYCDREMSFQLVGCDSTRECHDRSSTALRKLRAEEMVFIRDQERAKLLGFTLAEDRLETAGS